MNMPQFESPYFAAIDLGSNSFHMLIVRINETKIEIVDREKEMVQIARGLQPDGTLDAEARDRALQCLQRFSERLRDIPKRQVRAVGTKTLRTARQSRAFLKAAEKAIGVPIDIISGYEEARLVYAGLSNTVTSDGGHRLVIDIGGGSTELVIGKDCDPMVLESLPLGCVSFSERYILNSGGVTAKNMRRAYLAACSELENIRKIYLKKGWEIAYGTSGTMKAVAELLVEHDGGAVVRKASLEKLVEETINNGGITSTNVPKLRRDVLPAGLCILQAIFNQLKFETLHVADASLKEGLLYDTMGRLSNHDARIDTIDKLKVQYGIDQAQADRVSNTANKFWKQIKSASLPGISRTKILDWAAQVHEIGLSISHSGYHHHAHYILRHSDLAGFGRYEQYILANLVRAHRKKIDINKFEGLDLEARKAFIPILLCLRLAICLYRRREDVNILPTFRCDDSTYILSFQKEWLDDNPLTLAKLEQEVAYFSSVGLTLSIAS